MDVCNVKATDEDGFLAGSVMTSAKNTIGKERIWASKIVFLPLHPDTCTLLHDERVIASNSASKMSLMKCGHSGNFLFSWLRSRRVGVSVQLPFMTILCLFR